MTTSLTPGLRQFEDRGLDFLFFIFAALAVRSPTGKVTLNADRPVFHQFFYELRQKYGLHFMGLRPFHFMTQGAFPFSEELETAVARVSCYSFGAYTLTTEKLILTPPGNAAEWVDDRIDELGGLGWEKMERLLSEFERISLLNE